MKKYIGSSTEVVIPNGVTSIGDSAFNSCSNLSSVTISDSVTSIGHKAFSGCSSLRSIIIPNSVTSIEEDTFHGCSSLSSITIPESVTTIWSGVFYGCSEELTIYGTTGSYAETYAKENNIPFVAYKQELSNQTLSVNKVFSKAYGDKPFKLNAKVTKGNGALCYKSSDKKVATVDKNGRVTIKGTGIATITVTAKETSQYKEATTRITVKVSPKKPKAPVVKAQGTRKLKVSWKMDKNATGYEIQYSTDKNFKNKKATKTVTIKNSKTTSTIIKKLTKGKKYYVRMRSYKNVKVSGKTQKLSSGWSGIKNVKVK